MDERDDSGTDDAAPTAPAHAPLRNTLYRQVTKGQRRLTPGRMLLYRVAVGARLGTMRMLWATCRVTHVAGLEAARQAVRDSKSLIPVYWHQHMLFGARAVLDLRSEGLKPGFLISPSVDGTAPAMLVEKVGGVVIRGSSTHTGRPRAARLLRDHRQAAGVARDHARRPQGPAARVQAGRDHAGADHGQADPARRGRRVARLHVPDLGRVRVAAAVQPRSRSSTASRSRSGAPPTPRRSSNGRRRWPIAAQPCAGRPSARCTAAETSAPSSATASMPQLDRLRGSQRARSCRGVSRTSRST